MTMKAKRGLLSAETPRRSVTQVLAVDDFGELPARKREAAAQAKRNGHTLGSWHRRPNDPYGRFNSFCRNCGRIVVVATEPPDQLAEAIYGHALTQGCVRAE